MLSRSSIAVLVADAVSSVSHISNKPTVTPCQLYPLGKIYCLHRKQAQAKQQKRQILARQEEAKVVGRERGTSEACGPSLALMSSVSLTDGEGNSFPRRDRRRHRQSSRPLEVTGGCLSDSEVVMCDNSTASRWVYSMRSGSNFVNPKCNI